MTVSSSLDPDSFPAYRPLLYSLAQLWNPPERLPLSVWSERNITLSSEYASQSTNLRLFSWQREIFDAVTDPTVSEVVLYVSTQLVKTLCMQCAIAYVICEDPGPILLVEPKEDDAKAFSRERLAPMIRDCECLRGKISDSSHDGNLILMKEFVGGSLSLVGSISPANLARRSIRYLFCDEIDKYPASVGTANNKEGDPLSLARERMVTFGSRKKSILACSPTTASRSRIGKAYRQSDQRKPYVPCPSCRHYQLLRWSQVRWDSSLSKDLAPVTSYYECENLDCRAHWTDLDRLSACESAEWRASAPFAGIAGFWISHLYSPWKKMAEMVGHFLRVKDDRTQLQVFVNTVLAEEWQEKGETPDAEILYARRESYPFGQTAHVIPQRGLFLTAAVDVQDSPPRLEVETVAWGRGRECWSIDYSVIQCFAENGQALPVTSKELWDKLDAEILQRDWRHESGHTLPILVMAIDTGSRPKPVYEFARRHPQLAYGPAGLRLHAIRTVVPVKGTPDPLRIISSVSKEDAARKRQGVRIVGIGTHCAKQEIYDLLQHVRPKPDGKSLSGIPVYGCRHYPMYDMSFFDGLCAETRIVKENGDVVYEKRNPRNEQTDTAVYSRGASAIVGIDRFGELQWQQLESAVAVRNGVNRESGGEDEVVVVETAPVATPTTPSTVSSTDPTVLPVRRGVPIPSRTMRGRRGGFI